VPDLFHEYWETDDGGAFGKVEEWSDRQRPWLMPGARLVLSVRAASFNHAMQLYYEALGYGTYMVPDGVPDIVYSDEDDQEQQAYFGVRHLYTPDLPIFQARFYRGAEAARWTFIAANEEAALADAKRFFDQHLERELGDYSQYEVRVARGELGDDHQLNWDAGSFQASGRHEPHKAPTCRPASVISAAIAPLLHLSVFPRDLGRLVQPFREGRPEEPGHGGCLSRPCAGPGRREAAAELVRGFLGRI
jgi:hypothetical protein